MSLLRTRWAAIGAAVAITLGGGGVGLVGATVDSGERTVYVPITPCRIIDTRPEFQVGPKSSPLGPAETHTVTARGSYGECMIPTEATALSMNVTAVGATLPTFLTIWATGETMPNASSLNPHPGEPPVPNAVTTDLSAGGKFHVYNLQGTVHVLADVVGYYAHHGHDDLHYTKAEANERFVDARPLRVRLSPHELRPSERGSQWTFGWEHGPSVAAECLTGRVELPVGLDVTGMSIVYTAPVPGATVGVSLAATRATSGPLIGSVLPPIVGETTVAASTNGLESADLVLTASGPSTVLEDYDYVVGICTSDEIRVYGVEVSHTYVIP